MHVFLYGQKKVVKFYDVSFGTLDGAGSSCDTIGRMERMRAHFRSGNKARNENNEREEGKRVAPKTRPVKLLQQPRFHKSLVRAETRRKSRDTFYCSAFFSCAAPGTPASIENAQFQGFSFSLQCFPFPRLIVASECGRCMNHASTLKPRTCY